MDQHNIEASWFKFIGGGVTIALEALALLVDRDGEHVRGKIDVAGYLKLEGGNLVLILTVFLDREIILTVSHFDLGLSVIRGLIVDTSAPEMLNIVFKRDKEYAIVRDCLCSELLAKLIGPFGGLVGPIALPLLVTVRIAQLE